MGAETTLSDQKGKQLCELPKNPISNSNSNKSSNNKKKNRRRQKKMSLPPVQKLFQTCVEVFQNCGPGVIPSPDNIEKLRAVLDAMKPSDVGLTPDMPYFRRIQQTPAITYLHLYECEKFSMGIFCLPPSAVIPLHNHPEMTVFSKLLFGTMHIKSYDWVAGAPPVATAVSNSSGGVTRPEVRLAKIKVDSDFTAPCNTSILYPADGGNMHCFTAVTACAVLDVLGPPYSDPDGRHCTYYLEHPFARFSADGIAVPEAEKELHAWLQERNKPDDLVVNGALYRGPGIAD